MDDDSDDDDDETFQPLVLVDVTDDSDAGAKPAQPADMKLAPDVDVIHILDDDDQVHETVEPSELRKFVNALTDTSPVSVQCHEDVCRSGGLMTICLLLLGLTQIFASGMCYMRHGPTLSDELQAIETNSETIYTTERIMHRNLFVIVAYMTQIFPLICALGYDRFQDEHDGVDNYLMVVAITGLLGGDPHWLPRVDSPLPRPWTLRMLIATVTDVLHPTPLRAPNRLAYLAEILGPSVGVCVLMAYMRSYLDYNVLVYLVCNAAVAAVLMQLVIGGVLRRHVLAAMVSVVGDMTIRCLILYYLTDQPPGMLTEDQAITTDNADDRM